MNDRTSVRIVSIISGKGGVGKSVLAFNLAERLGAIGARVLLVDADINCGNLHILTNTTGEFGLREYIRGELSLKEAMMTTNHGFDLLAAGGGETIWSDGDVTPFANAVSRMRREASNYDLIIMDHSSGVSKAATVIAHASDLSLVTMVPELTSISDSYGLYKHLKNTDQQIDCRLLVNRTANADEAEYIHTKICAISERFLGHTPAYFGCLNEDSGFRQSIARQTSLSAVLPESDIVHELSAIAQRLLGLLSPALLAVRSSRISNRNEINKTTALADIRE